MVVAGGCVHAPLPTGGGTPSHAHSTKGGARGGCLRQALADHQRCPPLAAACALKELSALTAVQCCCSVKHRWMSGVTYLPFTYAAKLWLQAGSRTAQGRAVIPPCRPPPSQPRAHTHTISTGRQPTAPPSPPLPTAYVLCGASTAFAKSARSLSLQGMSPPGKVGGKAGAQV